jgi:hypothetical protein
MASVLEIASRGATRAARWPATVGMAACGAAALTLAVAAVVAAMALGAATASAETLPADCSNLQAQITAASARERHGEGETVVLEGVCKAGVTIPSESNVAIEGAPGTGSGFDGEGVSGAFISSAGGGVVTLTGLTFEDAKSSTAPAVKLYALRATLRDDVFTDDSLEGEGGAGALIETSSCAEPPSVPAVTVTGSSFTGDKLKLTGFDGGGALYIGNGCIGSTSVLDGDSFEGNTLEGSSNAQLLGGALEFAGVGEGSFPVLQEHDVFDSNRILAASGGDRGGGGEWLQGASLTSVADRFSRNAIPGTTGAHWSWGGGVGIINTYCGKAAPTESTLEDDVVAGNSIGSGTAEDLGGAGIYVGCPPEPAYPNHLRLLDSTVTENSVATPGGVAGIDGHSSDQLTIENSIVASNGGGLELGGFNGMGGLLTSAFSDVCDEAGTAPLAGEGDVCAAPLLADEANPSSFDVEETWGSPTIDVGSNALVPAGLTSDFYGNTRILAARTYTPPCGPGVLYTGERLYPPVVDMGASEYGPIAIPTVLIVCGPLKDAPPSHPPTVFPPPSISQGARGLVLLSFASPSQVGTMHVLATTKVTRLVTIVTKGRRRRVKRTETIPYASASFELPHLERFTLRLEPTRRALALLERRKHLVVALKITYDFAAGSSSTQLKTITVTYRPPARKREHKR